MVNVATYLDNILAFHRKRAANEYTPLSRDALLEQALDYNDNNGLPRSLTEHLSKNKGKADNRIPSLIAEIKKHSPSKGNIRADINLSRIAQDYEGGGASAISVLTDEEHFKGHLSYLETVRQATSLPLLRKDFLVCPEDVLMSRISGADAILLIAAALSDVELQEMYRLACDLKMDSLIEIHDEKELARLVSLEPAVIGINQRDLHTFQVDTTRAVTLREKIQEEKIITVAESGITSFQDLLFLGSNGFDAVLVGESLVRQSDHLLAVRLLLGNQTVNPS